MLFFFHSLFPSFPYSRLFSSLPCPSSTREGYFSSRARLHLLYGLVIASCSICLVAFSLVSPRLFPSPLPSCTCCETRHGACPGTTMGRARKGTCRYSLAFSPNNTHHRELIILLSKVYLLAEIIKTSLPSHVLFNIIRDSNIQPKWNDIALPHGTCTPHYRTLPPPPCMAILDAR